MTTSSGGRCSEDKRERQGCRGEVARRWVRDPWGADTIVEAPRRARLAWKTRRLAARWVYDPAAPTGLGRALSDTLTVCDLKGTLTVCDQKGPAKGSCPRLNLGFRETQVMGGACGAYSAKLANNTPKTEIPKTDITEIPNTTLSITPADLRGALRSARVRCPYPKRASSPTVYANLLTHDRPPPSDTAAKSVTHFSGPPSARRDRPNPAVMDRVPHTTDNIQLTLTTSRTETTGSPEARRASRERLSGIRNTHNRDRTHRGTLDLTYNRTSTTSVTHCSCSSDTSDHNDMHSTRRTPNLENEKTGTNPPYNKRLEESRDAIYRIPPPGNGTRNKHNARQTSILEYIQNNAELNDLNLQDSNPQDADQNRVNIEQWNARTLTKLKAERLAEFAKLNKIHVLCISELGSRRKIAHFPNYDYSDLNTQSGIFWTKNINAKRIKAEQLQQFENKRITTQMVLINGETLLIHPYIPPDVKQRTRKAYWNEIERFVTSENRPTIITGDLNTRDRRLDASVRARRPYLDPILIEFEVLNDITQPTRYDPANEEKGSVLDIAMCTSDARENILAWRLGPDLDSDHKITIIETALTITEPESLFDGNDHKSTVDINLTTENITLWLEYENIAEASLSKLSSIIRNSIAYKETPRENHRFWTTALRDACRRKEQAKEALQKARRDQKPEAYMEALKTTLRNESIEVLREYKTAKVQRYTELAETAVADSTGATTWKLIREINPELNSKRTPRTIKSKRADEEAEEIATKFASIYDDNDLETTEKERMEHDALIKALQTEKESNRPTPITRRELEKALKRAKIRSAGGVDGITNVLLKRACEEETTAEYILAAINNDIVKDGKIPDDLKIAKVRPLPKAKPGEFRPIALLSNLAKLVESIIETRLRHQAEKHLPPNQTGGREAHNTSQAMIRLLQIGTLVRPRVRRVP